MRALPAVILLLLLGAVVAWEASGRVFEQNPPEIASPASGPAERPNDGSQSPSPIDLTGEVTSDSSTGGGDNHLPPETKGHLPPETKGHLPPETKGLFAHDDRAHFHPHGDEVCRSGCALSNHPTEPLEVAEFRERLAQFAAGEMNENCQALETLLYYGKQSSDMLAKLGAGPLDSEKRAFLQRELSRTHARIEFRVVDDQGVTRVSLPPTRVPFDRRHEFKMDVHDIQPLMTSGTLKRVGLNHIWVRL